MPLSLHVLPPAFKLPSIDAECLAAITYLRFALPFGAWVLVADAGTHRRSEFTPTFSFMTLRVLGANQWLADAPFLVNGDDLIEGFDPIVRYLRTVSNGQWDLDAKLSRMQRADSLAISSHLIQNFAPLVDLSLYSSSENYHTATRPAYAAALGFPESWSIPPARYALAQERTQRLGLAASDLDAVSAEEPRTTESGPSKAFDEPGTSDPKQGNQTNPTLARQLSTRRKLGSQLERALQLALSLLDRNSDDYAFGPHPSLADCHLLAFASLAVIPNLPSTFLANEIKSLFPGLDTYISNSIRQAFGRDVAPEDALVRAAPMSADEDDGEGFGAYGNIDVGSGRTELPWRRPVERSTVETTRKVIGMGLTALKAPLVQV